MPVERLLTAPSHPALYRIQFRPAAVVPSWNLALTTQLAILCNMVATTDLIIIIYRHCPAVVLMAALT